MKKLLFYTAISSIIISHLYGQVPSIQWQQTLGGSSFDEGYSIQQTFDGGFIVAGSTHSTNGNVTGNHGGVDCWIIKLNSTGTIQWQKTLGGSLADVAYSIQQTDDRGYIIAGQSSSNDGDVSGHHGSTSSYDYWIVKLDSLGIQQWQKSLGGSGYDQPLSIKQTKDKGYIIAGFSTSNDGDVTGHHGLNYDTWIVKLDSSGLLKWQKSFGGTDSDGAKAIQQTKDNGYIVAGYSISNDGDVVTNYGSCDYWILKLDTIGNLQWQKTLGGTLCDIAYDVKQTVDGGYIVGGMTSSNDIDITNNHGQGDYWFVKLDSMGTTKWQRTYGSTGDEGISSIQQTIDGGYILVGTSDSLNGDVFGTYIRDYWLVKIDTVGAIEWQKTVGGTYSDRAHSIQQTLDNGYIVVGSSSSVDGDVLVSYGNIDFWVVKFSPLITQLNYTKDNIVELHIFPNPAKNSITISQTEPTFNRYEIYDVNGKLMAENKIQSILQKVDLSGYAEGMYIVKLIGNQKVEFKKIVVIDK